MTDQRATPLYMRRVRFDPDPEIVRSRESGGGCPVVTPFGLSAELVSRYDDVRAVLAHASRFSNAETGILGSAAAAAAEHGPHTEHGPHGERLADLRAGNLLAYDPPDHIRLRRMLTPEFTGHRMRRLEPRIVDIVEGALDDTERAGRPADLVSTFALPVPSLVICELLGVPYADRAQFQGRTRRQLDASLPVAERLAVIRQNREYMAHLVARARHAPGEDMLGMLVREHGDELSTAELVGIATLLLIAGHETTANMLALGTLALLRHPDQLAAVRDDPARVGPAVEELLRWLSIVHAGAPRTARDDVTIAGRTIAKGEHVLLSLPAANRDPAFLDDPDRLDITRGAIGHVAFGFGLHHCLGAPLARMELRIGLPALLRRFPGLALAVPYEQVEFRPHTVVYGLRSLPVTW
ncbi:cytochrome P450 [Frankia sp. QA3]|uniref:cytochrome P450 n=1 Tax=Frankia sp. QA3 TaxID=710111 RepID=UPI000269B8C0|nr:cytochrome P450 [Frankia sp. QA3]EIV90829.1 cytochrome P450 [Frankia sp. QA3]